MSVPWGKAVNMVAGRLNEAVSGAMVEVTGGGMPAIVVTLERLLDVCRILKDTPGLEFNYLYSVTSVDYIDHFEVVYNLHSLPMGHMVALKVRADHDQPVVPSLSGLWEGANFQEREVYDLMGIKFSGHPNLTRIFLWDEFEGHPLRKDFGLGEGGEAAWQQMPPMPQVENGGSNLSGY